MKQHVQYRGRAFLDNCRWAAAIAPASFVAVSLTGPLAWDGFLSYWVRNTAIVVWIAVMALLVGRNIYARRREEGLSS